LSINLPPPPPPPPPPSTTSFPSQKNCSTDARQIMRDAVSEAHEVACVLPPSPLFFRDAKFFRERQFSFETTEPTNSPVFICDCYTALHITALLPYSKYLSFCERKGATQRFFATLPYTTHGVNMKRSVLSHEEVFFEP